MFVQKSSPAVGADAVSCKCKASADKNESELFCGSSCTSSFC